MPFNRLQLASRKNGVKRFFYSSSACVYPGKKKLKNWEKKIVQSIPSLVVFFNASHCTQPSDFFFAHRNHARDHRRSWPARGHCMARAATGRLRIGSTQTNATVHHWMIPLETIDNWSMNAEFKYVFFVQKLLAEECCKYYGIDFPEMEVHTKFKKIDFFFHLFPWLVSCCSFSQHLWSSRNVDRWSWKGKKCPTIHYWPLNQQAPAAFARKAVASTVDFEVNRQQPNCSM